MAFRRRKTSAAFNLERKPKGGKKSMNKVNDVTSKSGTQSIAAAGRNYECMMIIGSNVAEDKRGELVKRFQKMAGSNVMVEKMGVRKFSVPINYRKEGFYVLLHFAAAPDKVAEMTAAMNITDGVERFMFVEKDEKMLAADAERRARRAAARAERMGNEEGKATPVAETKE